MGMSKITYDSTEVREATVGVCTYCDSDGSVEGGVFFKWWNEDEYDFVCSNCKKSPAHRKSVRDNNKEIDDIMGEE